MRNAYVTAESTAFANARRSCPRIITLVIAALLGLGGCGGGSASSGIIPIGVAITPSSTAIVVGATQAFTATVTGTTNQAVTWRVQESSGGTIDSTGLYTAPGILAGAFHIVATSKADSAALAVAEVDVRYPGLNISPATAKVVPGGTVTFVATVVGGNPAVTWTVREMSGGSISAGGVYSAPAAEGFYHVYADATGTAGTIEASVTVSVTTSVFSFLPAGSLQDARGYQTATLLADGRVLVAGGGYVGSDYACFSIPTAELRSVIGSGSFVRTGTLLLGRYHHTATLLQNGKVLVAGGYGDPAGCPGTSEQTENTAELYNPVAGTFGMTGKMNTLRGEHTATLLTDGNVLLTGGADQDALAANVSPSAELYNPTTGAFTPTGSMAVARFRHTATLLNNGKVLIVGGASQYSANPTPTAELYDPVAGSFTSTGSIAIGREQHTATLLADGRVLIAGGETPLAGNGVLDATSTAEIYDPATGLFSMTGSMIARRSSHTATLLASGTVLIAGGGAEDTSTAEVYDPTTSSFSTTGGMEIGRTEHTATLLPDGDVLVVGDDPPTALAEIYTNTSIFDY